ncbi:DUF4870 domain-containing protein [Lysobacter niabensis]|uniref:DUF4870 domain-containing protein n=1 Tax=Agrilutibacter niabensis TaxID=380628 RepID=UPI003615562A
MNDISQEERTWGMAAHLSSLATFLVPGGNVLGPLIVWLVKKDTMPFVADQGKEALNFNITVLIAAIISFILMIVVIGFLLLAVVAAGWLVLTILAAMESSKGVAYRYPFTLRLVS